MPPEGPIRRRGHDAVLDDLLDLQARLRGDPSSVLLASRPVPVDAEHRVVVRRRDLAVIHDPEPTAPPPAAGGDRRVEDLLARIDRLEHDLQAMIARLDGIAPRGPGWTERDDQVRTLQRTAHERLHRSS